MEFFENRGFQVKFFPNGVDTSRFSPASRDGKSTLREKWGISYNDFVVLHVGHIRRNRNLEVFKQLQEIPGLQVVIVGGTTNPADEALKGELISAGCLVFHRYINDISELYKMADLYVFPTKYRHDRLPQSYDEIGAVDMPLSVIEAMSCNLPVITSRFGALQRLFQPGDGLHYAKDETDIIAKVKNYSFKNVCETRQKVLPYDWNRIAVRIELEYQDLIRKIH